MAESPESKYPERMNSFMTTEHFTLSSARGIFNSEINNRIGIYFTTLSSLLIASAFLAQIAGFEKTFSLFVSITFPLVMVLGLLTQSRLMILGIMDSAYVRAINHIRQFYIKASPEVSEFLLFPPYVDDKSVGKYAGYTFSWRGNLLSSVNIVIFINSCIVTVFSIGKIEQLASLSANQMLPYGVIVFLLSYFLHAQIGNALIKSDKRKEFYEVRFPDENG